MKEIVKFDKSLQNAGRAAIESYAQDMVQKVKNGLLDPIEVMSHVAKIEKMCEQIRKGIKEDCELELDKYGKEAQSGVQKNHVEIKLQERKGSLDFAKDHLWKQIKSQLSLRETQLKEAEKMGEYPDENGEMVVPVPRKVGTKSIIATLK